VGVCLGGSPDSAACTGGTGGDAHLSGAPGGAGLGSFLKSVPKLSNRIKSAKQIAPTRRKIVKLVMFNKYFSADLLKDITFIYMNY